MPQKNQPIRILLADDHTLVRQGTRQLLEQEARLSVVGEAGDGEEALMLADNLRPDVIVLDVHMPRLNGLDTTRRLKELHPEIRILILSAYEDDHYVFPLLEAGADGYLLKTAGGDALIQAIYTVNRGETALDPHIAAKVVNQLTQRNKTAYRTETMIEALTEREMEVLQQVAWGKSNKEVADILTISPYTVQVHLRNIFSKLNVNSRTEAVTCALRQGWISLEHKAKT